MSSDYLIAVSQQLVLLGFHPELSISIDTESLSQTVKSVVPEGDEVSASVFKVIRLISSEIVLGRYQPILAALVKRNPIWAHLFKSIVKVTLSFSTSTSSLDVRHTPEGVELIDVIELDSDLTPHPICFLAPLRASLPAACTDYFKSLFKSKLKGLPLSINLSECSDLESPAASARVAVALGEAVDSIQTAVFACIRTGKVSLLENILYSDASQPSAISSVVITPLPFADDDQWELEITEERADPASVLLSKCGSKRILHVKPVLEDNFDDSPVTVFSPNTFSLKYLLSCHLSVDKEVVEFDYDVVLKSCMESFGEMKTEVGCSRPFEVTVGNQGTVDGDFLFTAVLSSLSVVFSELGTKLMTSLVRNLTGIELYHVDEERDIPVEVVVERATKNAAVIKDRHDRVKKTIIVTIFKFPKNSKLMPEMSKMIAFESPLTFDLVAEALKEELEQFSMKFRALVGFSSTVDLFQLENPSANSLLAGFFGISGSNLAEVLDGISLFAPRFSVNQKLIDEDEEDESSVVFQNILDGIKLFSESSSSFSTLSISSVSIGVSSSSDVFFDPISSTLHYYWSFNPVSYPSSSDVKTVLCHSVNLPSLPSVDVSSKVEALKDIKNSVNIGLRHLEAYVPSSTL
ncbi:hypothetical protein GEMRC1_007803 [Eukaryota sp. GEM-RC1]